MTRINVVPVTELHNKHLLAEYRELPRIFKAARKWHERGDVADLPQTYRLGKGHVLFFYDKLIFCFNRQVDLYDECIRRGYSPNNKPDPHDRFWEAPICLFNDYQPTREALRLNRERIADRLSTMKV